MRKARTEQLNDAGIVDQAQKVRVVWQPDQGRSARPREQAEKVGITEQNLSLLQSGKVRGNRSGTMAAICDALDGQPGDILEAFNSG